MEQDPLTLIGTALDAAPCVPLVAGALLVFFWVRGLRWSRRRMRAATQLQTVTAKTERTPLQIVLSSALGCLGYGLLLAIPILAGVILFLLTR